MSIEVGTAYVTLVPSLKGFSRATESAIASSGIGGAIGRATSKDAERAGTSAGGLFSRAFNRANLKSASSGGGGIYLAGLLRNIRTYGYAVSGVVGLTVGLGLKAASSFQQANVAFTTILGSATKAKALFAELVQFAKTTPFNLPNVVAASQQLLAFGFRAKQIKPILTSLGDAAAGLSLGNEGLSRLILAVGQISAKGRLQSQELLQLTEAGVPALRILGNTFGITTGKLQAYIQRGLIPASKAIPALLRGLETGTKGVNGVTAKFGGLMAKQSKTLGGLFSNLKDALTVGLAHAVQPLVPVLERAIPRATKALGGALRAASGDLAEFLHGLGVAKDHSKGVTTGFEQFGRATRTVAHDLSVVAKFVGRNASLFAHLGIALLAAVAASKVLKIAMIGVNAALDANPVGLVVLAVEALVFAFVFAYTKSKTFRDIVSGVFHALERVVGVWAGINVTMFKYVADAMLSFVGVMIHGAASAFGWVPFVGSKLKGAAQQFDNFRSSVDSTLSGLASDSFNLGLAGGANWNSGWQRGIEGTGANSPFRDPGHPGYIGSVAKNTKNTANKAGPVFQQIGSGLGGNLAKGVKASGTKAAQAAQTLVDKILAPLRKMRDQAKQLAAQIVQAIDGDTGFGALANLTDSLGAAFGLSVHSIIFGLTAQLTDVTKFRHELNVLKHRGLSNSAVQEIAGEGVVQGGKVAAALMSASSGQLHKISKLRAQTNAAANGIGRDVARDKYGAALVREVAQTRRAVEHAAKSTSLSNKTISRLERAYKAAAESVQPYVKPSELDHHHGKKVRQHS